MQMHTPKPLGTYLVRLEARKKWWRMRGIIFIDANHPDAVLFADARV